VTLPASSRRAVAGRAREGGTQRFAFKDLLTALSLVGALACAMLLPQRYWLAAAQRFASRRPAARSPSQHAPSSARAIRAYQLELRIQNWGAILGRWSPRIAVEGQERITAALQSHGSAVLWVAHSAYNSNVVKRTLHERGYALHHLSRPEHGFSKTRVGMAVLNPVRCRAEDRDLASRIVIANGDARGAMRHALSRLRDGGSLVSITAGAWEGAKLLRVPFLDAQILLGSGAANLARATGAPLLPVFAARTGSDQRFTVTIGEPIEVARDGDKDAALLAAAAAFAHRTEAFVARYPDQWRGWSSLVPAATALAPDVSRRRPTAAG